MLGLADGEVHAYDENGKFLMKIPMLCIEHVEMEAALTSIYSKSIYFLFFCFSNFFLCFIKFLIIINLEDLRKDLIVAMSWYAPTKPCVVPIIRRVGEQGIVFF